MPSPPYSTSSVDSFYCLVSLLFSKTRRWMYAREDNIYARFVSCLAVVDLFCHGIKSSYFCSENICSKFHKICEDLEWHKNQLTLGTKFTSFWHTSWHTSSIKFAAPKSTPSVWVGFCLSKVPDKPKTIVKRCWELLWWGSYCSLFCKLVVQKQFAVMISNLISKIVLSLTTFCVPKTRNTSVIVVESYKKIFASINLLIKHCVQVMVNSSSCTFHD